MPLIVGFFVIALMFCGAAVMASDAFTRQRDLQSICDAAATSAANSVDFAAARGSLGGRSTLPLGDVQEAVNRYVAGDRSLAKVTAVAASSADAAEVTVQCSTTSKLAFAAMFGRGGGVRQSATSTARSNIE